MNSGEFKQRLVFKRPGGQDDYGYPIEPTNYTKAWGKLKTLKGNSFYAAAQSNMEHNREFTIRYQSKLNDENRPSNLQLFWKGKEHEVITIENVDGLNETMLVVAKAVS